MAKDVGKLKRLSAQISVDVVDAFSSEISNPNGKQNPSGDGTVDDGDGNGNNKGVGVSAVSAKTNPTVVADACLQCLPRESRVYLVARGGLSVWRRERVVDKNNQHHHRGRLGSDAAAAGSRSIGGVKGHEENSDQPGKLFNFGIRPTVNAVSKTVVDVVGKVAIGKRGKEGK